MEEKNRKELLGEYKEKPVVGGVYCIVCKGNNRKWVKSTTNMEGVKNRFDFAISIQSCPEPSMQREFNEYGNDSFEFQILEKLEKEAGQTPQEFSADVKTLLELWKGKEYGDRHH